VARKRAVAARSVKAGVALTPAMVAYKRSDAGVYPDECRPLFGQIVAKDLVVDDPIDWTAVR
jgi:sialic acid synthase SpsE